MPDDHVCPDCGEPHEGPGICKRCNVEYVNLSDFNLDEEPARQKSVDFDLMDDADEDRGELSEAA